jgi:hypothetical protein
MVFGDKASIQKGLVKKEFDFLEANSGK